MRFVFVRSESDIVFRVAAAGKRRYPLSAAADQLPGVVDLDADAVTVPSDAIASGVMKNEVLRLDDAADVGTGDERRVAAVVIRQTVIADFQGVGSPVFQKMRGRKWPMRSQLMHR